MHVNILAIDHFGILVLFDSSDPDDEDSVWGQLPHLHRDFAQRNFDEEFVQENNRWQPAIDMLIYLSWKTGAIFVQ